MTNPTVAAYHRVKAATATFHAVSEAWLDGAMSLDEWRSAHREIREATAEFYRVWDVNEAVAIR
jgi:hypothetical protein